VAREGWPLALGEWGLSASWTNADLFMAEVLAMADRMMAGWAYWAWDPGGWSFIDGDLNERESADQIVRVYPPRIAGRPVSFGYNPDTRVFRLEFTDLAGVTGPTEIYIPARRHYPEGFALSVSDPEGSWHQVWDATREVVQIHTTPNASGHVIEVRPQ